jgi:Uma2 family endonuclease
MSEAEFVAWVDEESRAEWVDGEVLLMAPVSGEHAKLAVWLLGVTTAFVEKHDLGEIFGTEFTARFSKLRRRRLPDVMFVSKSRRKLIKENHFEGAPDLIMEIVSPDSESRDWRDKFTEYEKVGVREYWIIDPSSRHAEGYALNRRKRYVRIDEEAGVINSVILRGFWLKTDWLWPSSRPSLLQTLQELGLA